MATIRHNGAAHLAKAFKNRFAAVKLLLLDQQIVAGLGNIYVCEALHRAKIHPEREAGKVSRAALNRLVPEIRAVLEEAIRAGGSTLRDYVRPDGELGYFAKDWRVYGREGDPCVCGKPVQRLVQGGRSTFFCASCQI
jgi:formamidopyrimidine-DNA glycosylase